MEATNPNISTKDFHNSLEKYRDASSDLTTHEYTELFNTLVGFKYQINYGINSSEKDKWKTNFNLAIAGFSHTAAMTVYRAILKKEFTGPIAHMAKSWKYIRSIDRLTSEDCREICSVLAHGAKHKDPSVRIQSLALIDKLLNNNKVEDDAAIKFFHIAEKALASDIAEENEIGLEIYRHLLMGYAFDYATSNKTDKAIKIIKDCSYSKNPNKRIFACNLCSILIEIGHIDVAFAIEVAKNVIDDSQHAGYPKGLALLTHVFGETAEEEAKTALEDFFKRGFSSHQKEGKSFIKDCISDENPIVAALACSLSLFLIDQDKSFVEEIAKMAVQDSDPNIQFQGLFLFEKLKSYGKAA